MIAAGGRGERAAFTDDQPKQFRPLGGRPLLEYCLDELSRAGCDPIVLVVPERFMSEARVLFGARANIVFATGGETRQDSVASGLEEVSTDLVVVHDGARPFATADLVRSVIEAVGDHDGAIAAMPVDETLKRVDGTSIVETVDRSHLWRAHTPQVFKSDALRSAHEKARQEGFIGTDDASLLERYGGTMAVVPSPRSNIKLTYPEDFALAEAILRGGLR
ncbi:MAG: 2-C-methyl-D-erythritol 4-phosphate cytidylyltransferase [Actinomycetota bacterium]